MNVSIPHTPQKSPSCLKLTTIINMKGSLWLMPGLLYYKNSLKSIKKKSELYGHSKKLQKRASWSWRAISSSLQDEETKTRTQLLSG